MRLYSISLCPLLCPSLCHIVLLCEQAATVSRAAYSQDTTPHPTRTPISPIFNWLWAQVSSLRAFIIANCVVKGMVSTMHMDVVHDPERVKGYETLLARRHQDVCLRDPSKAKVSLSPNLGDLCGRRAVQGQTSSARTDGIIVTYIDEHVIGDDEKHKDAGLGRFGDGQKLPPKIIVFDPGIDLCGSRAENGSYTPTSTQLSIAFPSGFGESIEGKPGKPDTEYAMSSKTIDGPYIEHIAIEVDNGNLELNLKDRVQSPSDIEVKGIYLDAHIDVFLSSEEEFDKKFTDRTVKESLMSSFAGAKKFMGQAPWLK